MTSFALAVLPSPAPSVVVQVGASTAGDRLLTAGIALGSAIIGALVASYLATRREARRLRLERTLSATSELVDALARAQTIASQAENYGSGATRSKEAAPAYREMQACLLTHVLFLDNDDLRQRFDDAAGLFLDFISAVMLEERIPERVDYALIDRHSGYVRRSAEALAKGQKLPPYDRPWPGSRPPLAMWSPPDQEALLLTEG